MRTSVPKQVPAIAAAIVFAIAAGYDAWHLVTASAFDELSRTLSVIVALVNVIVWSSAAVLLVLRPASAALLRASFGLSLVGTILVLSHGLVLRGVLMDPVGIGFLLAAPVLAVLLKLAWTPFPWTRREPLTPPARTFVRTRDGAERPAI